MPHQHPKMLHRDRGRDVRSSDMTDDGVMTRAHYPYWGSATSSGIREHDDRGSPTGWIEERREGKTGLVRRQAMDWKRLPEHSWDTGAEKGDCSVISPVEVGRLPVHLVFQRRLGTLHSQGHTAESQAHRQEPSNVGLAGPESNDPASRTGGSRALMYSHRAAPS